jgi:phenylalanyl-tRNA synthetase alpha chain
MAQMSPKELFASFLDQLKLESKEADVLNLKAKYLGKDGVFSTILKSLKDATPEEKKNIGKDVNEYKNQIESLVKERLFEIEEKAVAESLSKNWHDISLRDSFRAKGLDSSAYHPITTIQREIEDLFISMGFEVEDGPYIETEYYNFEALNIPADHPARDMQDTFWFKDLKHVLRTHTSCVQMRGMEKRKAPFKFIAPGKVFRCERTDASHEMCFHQVEGMMVAENLSVANLIYFMKQLLSGIFKKEVEVRLRPGFFPFVEPGFELDIKCLICSGKGCPVCKNMGWVELLPCGMVHPNVLKHGNIDTSKYNGFAFGLGLDRLVMMRYGIEDIRHLHSTDLRFNSQFALY